MTILNSIQNFGSFNNTNKQIRSEAGKVQSNSYSSSTQGSNQNADALLYVWCKGCSICNKRFPHCLNCAFTTTPINHTTVNRSNDSMVSQITTPTKKEPKLIILEGNISAGKTSLSAKLGDILGYSVFLEPITTNPYLTDFYREPSKYALVMQLWLLDQRYNTFLNAVKYALEYNSGVILDRSVYSDWVFAENCRLEGLISEKGFIEYKNQREKYLSNIPIPEVTLYLDVKPEECLKRIQTLRKRDCEQNIPLSYLKGLDSCYSDFLKEMNEKGSNVLSVDWTHFGDPNTIANEIKPFLSLPSSLSNCINKNTLSTINDLIEKQKILNKHSHFDQNKTEKEFLIKEMNDTQNNINLLNK
ncbi:hypothetical protein CYY_006559 [Polysphondylium violaceum]|uniref:Deoxynucleoside kinase domain-containing protein n=1 Tax=Polysphondylium violaceum TaxID=133409 RepID=A0A8J4PQT6_9MYCE|nr:hypothetical protein CYY_006559 [Polysphondylium violaceum]